MRTSLDGTTTGENGDTTPATSRDEAITVRQWMRHRGTRGERSPRALHNFMTCEAIMSTPFDGTWTDLNGDTITVTSQDQILTVVYSNGRGPFQGMAAAFGVPVIYVDFNDARPGTGVMALDGGKILWNNGTQWTQG